MAVFFQEHITIPHSDKIKKLESKCISQAYFKDTAASLRQLMKLMIIIIQIQEEFKL